MIKLRHSYEVFQFLFLIIITTTMRTMLLTLLLAIIHSSAISQVFHENFEYPDSVIHSGGSWSLNDRIKTSGNYCDSVSIQYPGEVSTLTTLPFNTLGMDSVYLYFNHICKTEFFDGMRVEVSPDNGLTWILLCADDYVGQTVIDTTFCRFQETCYVEWLPGIANAVPDQLWWRKEIFNLSFLAQSSMLAQVRFTVSDMNNSGGAARSGWFIDDIEVGDSLQPIFINTALNESIFNNNSVSIVPNPVIDQCSITVESSQNDQISIDLYNIFGQQVETLFNGEMTSGKKQFAFDVSDLPSGTYFIHLTGNRQRQFKYFVKL